MSFGRSKLRFAPAVFFSAIAAVTCALPAAAKSAPTFSLAPVQHGTSSALEGQQPAPPGPPGTGVLASATATGSSKFSSSEIIAASGMKQGEPVTRATFQLAANRLAETGLFSEVHYRYSSQGQNVTVQFQVADAKTLPVTFDNFPWFTNDQLDAAIRQSVGLFDGTAPEFGTYVDEIAAAIKQQLTKLNIAGRVEHRVIERLVGSGLEVQFRLVGPSLNVGKVEFTDSLAQHDERVAARLQDLIGKPFSRYYTDIFITEQVRPIYLSQGFLQADFSPPEARFSGNPNGPELSPVTIVVPIKPGPRYVWGGAQWTGNTVFSAAALDRMLGLSTGQTADGLAIEAGWQKIREQYGSKGYLDATLDPTPSFDSAKSTVTYSVAINEGQPYRMGKLVITGLAVEAEKRVRKAWEIHPDQTFDLGYYHAFMNSIVKEALAGLPVHYQRIGHYLQRHEKKHVVDVLLDFE